MHVLYMNDIMFQKFDLHTYFFKHIGDVDENTELSDVVVCDRKNSDHMILDRVNAEPSSIEMVQVEDSEDDLAKLNKPLLVYIDGPFGAPTSQIFRAQHAVLIGTGIGVTPFASILQSIMHRYWQARNTCPKCQYQWTSDLSASVGLNLRKVYITLFLLLVLGNDLVRLIG